jgi:hypothetical protein
VNASGGKAIAVKVDHTRPEEVEVLCERQALTLLERAVTSHLVTARLSAPWVAQRSGLIVELTAKAPRKSRTS